MKRTLLAMALLLTSVFGVTGCGSDDGEAPVESRIKNSTGYWNYGDIIPQSYGERYDPLAYYHEIDRLDEMYHYNDQYDDYIEPRIDAFDVRSKADCDIDDLEDLEDLDDFLNDIVSDDSITMGLYRWHSLKFPFYYLMDLRADIDRFEYLDDLGRLNKQIDRLDDLDNLDKLDLLDVLDLLDDLIDRFFDQCVGVSDLGTDAPKGDDVDGG